MSTNGAIQFFRQSEWGARSDASHHEILVESIGHGLALADEVDRLRDILDYIKSAAAAAESEAGNGDD